MTFTIIFKEVRFRVLWLLVSLSCTFIGCYLFSEDLLFLVAKPYLKVIPDTTFLSIKLTESFTTYINSSVILALFYTVPVFVYQIWCFFIPSCSLEIRKNIGWYAIASGLMLLLILELCFNLVLPVIWFFLAQCSNTSSNIFQIQLQPRISDYCLLTLRLCLLFLMCSQIPLCFLYVIDKTKLTDCIRYRRLIWLTSILLGALVTPPEWQLLTSGCFVIFIEFTLFLGYVKCEYTNRLHI